MGQLTLKAMAKINLGIDVLGRMENGYHQVKMVMQTIDLYDELTFEKTEDEKIHLSVDNSALPADESNLVYRAAKLLRENCGVLEGVAISLKKRIPMAAGMAGGSTDAAAVFVGMNRLYGLGLSEEEMMRLAVRIGADVPYCIMGGTALAEGIGEILTPLEDAPDCFLVIAKPDIDVSTKFVYDNLHADTLPHHPDIDGVVEGIRAGSLVSMAAHMENVLETVTAAKYPIIKEIEKLMESRGAVKAMMSGSGPTVFGIFTERKAAADACEDIKKIVPAAQVFVTGFARRTCVTQQEETQNGR